MAVRMKRNRFTVVAIISMRRERMAIRKELGVTWRPVTIL